MKRIARVLICITLISLLIAADLTAFASELKPTQIRINNNTGASITEVYIYPNYSAKVGDARNKGWIRKQESGVINVTAVEANRDCLWNMTVVFKPQDRYAFRVTWEDIDLSNYLGQTVEFTVNDDGTYSMTTVGVSDAIEFDFYNDLGYTVSEVYFYPANSSTWGQLRNNKAMNDQDQIHIKFNAVESSSSATWNLRITLAINGYWYTIEFEDVDLNYYNGGTMVMTVDRDGYAQLYRLENYF